MYRLLPPNVPRAYRIIDTLMIPIMFALGGFKKDSIQETHPWHSYRSFDPKKINTRLCVVSTGSDDKTFKRHFLFLFHAPILGGWRHYLAVSPKKPLNLFYVGWIVMNSETHTIIEHGIQKLPIHDRAIRVLTGPPVNTTYFFTVNAEGEQVAADTIGQGILGDHLFPDTRLF